VRKRPNYQLAKIHRNYTVDQAGLLFGVHRNTVRHWIKRGLPVIPGRPLLILGRDLRAFLQKQREQAKRHCQSGEIYCMRCREPRMPAVGMVEYQRIALTRARFVALCSRCGTVMYRSVNPTNLPPILASMLVRLPAGSEHIGGTSQPIVDSDFKP
jgi:hypothetical protein